MSGLASYFDGFAAKKLSAVEVNPRKSNQHEFNGVSGLKALFGPQKRTILARHFDMDALEDQTNALTNLTWYNAREKHPRRNEWRLYYSARLAQSLHEGGTLIVAHRDEAVFLFTAAPGSPGSRALLSLFSMDGLSKRFTVETEETLLEKDVSAAEQYVLAELGLTPDEEAPLVEMMFETFGTSFPKGEELSRFVRENTFGADGLVDPDQALLAWARVELELFNAMEAKVEAQAMEDASSLDEKLVVAMRVFQRRKSRAGKAFEYHLRALFDMHGVPYSPNPVTEGREEPDFVFPGISEYRDESWPDAGLAMLAAKQTLRDRWRQVLQEANRIPRKHLATLDVAVSSNQIREIDASGIQLVIPRGLHDRYSEDDVEFFWTLRKFIEFAGGLRERVHAP